MTGGYFGRVGNTDSWERRGPVLCGCKGGKTNGLQESNVIAAAGKLELEEWSRGGDCSRGAMGPRGILVAAAWG